MAEVTIKTAHGTSTVEVPVEGSFQRKQWDRLIEEGKLEIVKPTKAGGTKKAPAKKAAARKAPAKKVDTPAEPDANPDE